MNFSSCPLGEGWIGASQPVGLAGSGDNGFELGVGAVASRGPKERARIHSLLLGQIVWLDTRLPVYLAHWEIERAGRVEMRGVELVFPLDPWELGESEAFCRAVRAAGIGLIPLPVAPVIHSAESSASTDGVSRPGWKIPDEETLARRARELLQLQVVGMAEWGQEAQPSMQIEWIDPVESLAVLARYEERLQWAWMKKTNESESAV